MAIVRAPRPDNNFYILDKRISEDARLSWGARGMLVFLLGKPDHWKVNIEALVNQTISSARPAKKSVIYGYIAELMRMGYMTRRKHASGSLDYLVHETPSTPEPDSKNPNLALPDLEKPNLGNQPLVSIESKQGLNESEDLFGSGDAGAPPAAAQKKPAQRKSCSKAEPAPSTPAWDAYRSAYAKRYGVDPLRNAKVNSSLKTIVNSVGAEKAPDVVTHYLTLTGYYAERQHDIGVLVSDLQKVWNSMHRAGTGTTYQRPVTAADFKSKDYSRGVNADGTF